MTTRDETRQRQARGAGFINPRARPRGPNGRALCRQCDREVPPRRQTFCSTPCVDVWKLDHSPALQREAIFQRDRGVCASCQRDTEDLRRRKDSVSVRSAPESIERLRPIGPAPFGDVVHAERWRVYETARIDWTLEQQVRKDALVTELRAQGFGQRPLGHFWEMDHVVEVVRGGGGKFNPENLQTLCIPCHRRKTARLASERALMWRLGGALIRAGDPSVCVGKRKLIYLDVCRVKMLGFALHSLVVDVSQSLR